MRRHRSAYAPPKDQEEAHSSRDPIRRERSLVAFTLLTQTAVGGYLWLLLPYLVLGRGNGWAAAGAPFRNAWTALFGVMLLGLVFSFLHLGRPRNAWRVLANWRTSWLSREVLCALVFAGAGLLFIWMERSRTASAGARLSAAGLAALAGLGMVIILPGVYRLRTIPAWNRWETPASFTITVFLLGGLAAGSCLSIAPCPCPEAAGPFSAGMALISVPLLGAQILTLRSWLVGLRRGGEAETRAARRILVEYRGLLRWRVGFAAGGAVLALGALFHWPFLGPSAFLIPAFILTFASETLGRVLFYAARVRQGL